MLELGRRAGKEVTCLLTDMDQPLGRAVGNALEIREALDTVRGEGRPTSPSSRHVDPLVGECDRPPGRRGRSSWPGCPCSSGRWHPCC